MASHTSFTGLGTRVAVRTFLMFCACAVVPSLLVTTLGYRIVSASFHEQADNRLHDATKAYGLLLFERLRQADELLYELAGAALKDELGANQLTRFESSRLRIVDITTMTDDANPVTDVSGATDAKDSLVLSTQKIGQEPEVSLTIKRSDGVRTVSIVGALQNDYLWDNDAILLSQAQLCVHLQDGGILHCSGEPVTDDSALTSNWSLFLPPRYHAAPWSIRATQANTALGTLASLRHTTLVVTIASILIALLLSVVQIRRSHYPLTQLTQAARRMGKRRFDTRLTISSKDEYAKLGRAFNTMTRSLSRQFLLLRTLARIDRLILEEPSMALLVKRVLPSLPRLLESPAVALVLQTNEELTAYVARIRSPAIEVFRLQGKTLSALERACGDADFELAAADCMEMSEALACRRVLGLRIDVGTRLAGVLLLSRNERLTNATQRRQARPLARRFAIALGSEERRVTLLRQAYYDALTGLPNRQLFKDRLEQDLARARQTGTSLALLYIDLDRFKNVNDSLGHSVGDQLLCEVGKRFSASLSGSDTLARLGGDEFVVIAASHDLEPAHVLVERLQASLAEPVVIQGSQCFIRASFGVTVYPRDGEDAESLLRHADTAMYRAKSSGRGGMAYFEEAMNREVQYRLHVEQRLRIALRERTLRLAYQPKINLLDGSIHGVEALARWQDVELGYVSPTVFIPIAEECGLIEELGAWALLEACTVFAKCLSEGLNLQHVSVNASMRQLHDARFLEDVGHALRVSGIPPGSLEIEVTESMLADNPTEAAATLNRLRDLGIRVAIDDFGTGYSSMAALSALPADVLKIDRSFVDGCDANPTTASVVEAIISMAHVLGKVTVAEGVETREQLATLRRLGCDFVQGYLFAQPLPGDALAQLPLQVAAWTELLSNCHPRQSPARLRA